ncbi:MAG TPA: hypothetical protein VJW76_16035, partial [Verrucomicrobiae bacterium]|nr:hypothetical protein [Verrucomicrobiae bacterium]
MHGPVLFEPPFPIQQVIGLGVGVLLLALASYALATGLPTGKKILLVLLRMGVVAGIVVVLCRPMAVKPAPESAEKPVFTVLVDSSASMNTKDEGQESRLKAVAAALQSARGTFEGELARRYQVNFEEFSEEARASTFDEIVRRDAAAGAKTDIATALFGVTGAGQGKKHAGVLLISDG